MPAYLSYLCILFKVNAQIVLAFEASFIILFMCLTYITLGSQHFYKEKNYATTDKISKYNHVGFVSSKMTWMKYLTLDFYFISKCLNHPRRHHVKIPQIWTTSPLIIVAEKLWWCVITRHPLQRARDSYGVISSNYRELKDDLVSVLEKAPDITAHGAL